MCSVLQSLQTLHVCTTAHTVRFQLHNQIAKTCPSVTLPTFLVHNWHYRAVIMIDWACIKERGVDVISSLSPSVFSFSNWLTAFLVPSEACQLAYRLKKALFLSVWLIESLAVCLKQLILSCHFKRLSHFFNQPAYQPSVSYSLFLFYLCWYTISWKDLYFVFLQLFAHFSCLSF